MSGGILDPPGEYPLMADRVLVALEDPSWRSWILGHIPFSAPWGIRVDSPHGWFCQVSGGPCVLEIDGCPQPVSVCNGDVVFLPSNCKHCWKDRLESPTVPLSDLLEPRRADHRETLPPGIGGPHTSLFAGCFMSWQKAEPNPLDMPLPRFVHIKTSAGNIHGDLQHLLKMIEVESTSKQPYGQAIINRLVQILVMKVVQDCLGQTQDRAAHVLQARMDPHISLALALIHDQPECPWTVARLAERAAMSRSAFCAHFASLVGRPPFEYLTEWRMFRACQLLRRTPAGLKEVAARVGYGSAAAFGKAFARWAGTTPHAYRGGSDPVGPVGRQNG